METVKTDDWYHQLMPENRRKVDGMANLLLEAESKNCDSHLLDIDKTASEWMDRMLPQMMKAAGVKARDQIAWIGLVNNCKAQVKEIIFF